MNSITKQERICKRCGAKFIGNTIAWYCPDCDEAKVVTRVQETKLQYTHQENTYKIPESVRKTGIKVNQFRVVENQFQGKERLELYLGFLEFLRLGDYIGNLDQDEATKLRDFITEWLHRKFGLSELKITVSCWNCDNFNVDNENQCKIYGKFDVEPPIDKAICNGTDWECATCGFRIKQLAKGM